MPFGRRTLIVNFSCLGQCHLIVLVTCQCVVCSWNESCLAGELVSVALLEEAQGKLCEGTGSYVCGLPPSLLACIAIAILLHLTRADLPLRW